MVTNARRNGTRRKLSETDVLGADAHAHWSEMGASEHFVQFYETDEFLLNSVTGYIGAGLDAGDTCILVIMPEHRHALEALLTANGLDLAGARARGSYVYLDAVETLSRFMVDGLPDSARFAEVVGGVVARAAQTGRHVRIFGEMVAWLWAEGKRDAAIRLEELWNDLQTTAQSFSLYCAYPMRGFAGEVYGDQFGEICQRHSRVIPDESYSALNSPEERIRAITLLQQKASSLADEIAERKAAEEALIQALERAARAEAEAASARMDEFLNIAGHELRTPLTTIRVNMQLLTRHLVALGEREEPASEELMRIYDLALGLLVRMNGSSKRLGRLVDDLLDVSRIKAGRLDLRPEAVDLAAIVRDAVEEQRLMHPERLILFESPRQGAIPLVADADRLGQVVTNYLSNALKYSTVEQPVAVSLRVEDDQARVLVRDRGIGIATEEHKRIWELFARAPDLDVQSGLGLGLHISKTIVEQHGGTVGVESAPGEGSTFWFTLPLAQTDNQEPDRD